VNAEADAVREDDADAAAPVAPAPESAPWGARTASTLVERTLVPVSLALIALSIGLVLTFDYGRDQAIYALVAREILAGKMPYKDAFDFKPPGIFLVYALARAIFGSAEYGIRVVEALSMVASVAFLCRLSRIHFGDRKIGFVAGALASLLHAQLDFWHTGQPETFGGMLTLAGLCTATAAIAPGSLRRRALLWVGTGVLFGFAGLMKPPLAGGGAIVAAAGALHSFFVEKQRGRSAVPLIATAVGGALPFAIVLGWFKARGALGDLHEVLFVFTPFYTKISWENQSVIGMTYFGFEEWLMTYSSALFAGLVALLLLRPRKEETAFVLTIAALIAVHITGVVMQAKFFPYHWGATFPLTALLAGLGIVKLLRWSASKGPVALAGATITLVGVSILRAPVPNLASNLFGRAAERFDLFVRGPMDLARRDALASVADVNAGENRAVAAYVKAHTKPSDRLFVWGFECVIYDMADRPIASRYIYNVPQRAVWSRTEMQAQLMPELLANKPAAIVVEHNDIFPMVTGDNLDSARSLWQFQELRELIANEYDLTTSIGDFDVYMRAPPEARQAVDVQ
jgi:hypothetical protein